MKVSITTRTGESRADRLVCCRTVSMVDGQLFDKLAYIANKLRQKVGSKTVKKPFGGIQVRFDHSLHLLRVNPLTTSFLSSSPIAGRDWRLFPAPARHEGSEPVLCVPSGSLEGMHRSHRQLDAGLPSEGYSCVRKRPLLGPSVCTLTASAWCRFHRHAERDALRSVVGSVDQGVLRARAGTEAERHGTDRTVSTLCYAREAGRQAF